MHPGNGKTTLYILLIHNNIKMYIKGYGKKLRYFTHIGSIIVTKWHSTSGHAGNGKTSLFYTLLIGLQHNSMKIYSQETAQTKLFHYIFSRSIQLQNYTPVGMQETEKTALFYIFSVGLYTVRLLLKTLHNTVKHMNLPTVV